MGGLHSFNPAFFQFCGQKSESPFLESGHKEQNGIRICRLGIFCFHDKNFNSTPNLLSIKFSNNHTAVKVAESVFIRHSGGDEPHPYEIDTPPLLCREGVYPLPVQMPHQGFVLHPLMLYPGVLPS